LGTHHYALEVEIFLAKLFGPLVFGLAGSQRESLQVPKKEVKHGAQRLGVDEERLP
jgi:hypothetical protein